MDTSTFGFEILDAAEEAYRLRFRRRPPTSTLEGFIAKGDPQTSEPFPESDLTPRRVSFVRVDGPTIDCVPMNWAEILYTNLDSFRARLPEEERLSALSVATLVETDDGLFPLARRSEKVALYPDCWHVGAAGYVGLELARTSQSVLPAVLAELQGELGVSADRVSAIRQLGVCRHVTPDVAEVEICFHLKTSLTSDEVREAAKTARESWEGVYSFFDRSQLCEMLGRREPFVPAATCAIMLAFDLC